MKIKAISFHGQSLASIELESGFTIMLDDDEKITSITPALPAELAGRELLKACRSTLKFMLENEAAIWLTDEGEAMKKLLIYAIEQAAPDITIPEPDP